MPAIYRADVWCDSCADAIKAAIKREGAVPKDTTDERRYDSDEYPKYMSNDEASDSPCHCAAGERCLEAAILPSGRKIGALLSTALTSDGVEYVRDAVREGGEVAEFWREAFSAYDLFNRGA
ncbi:MAG TPA: hypothetical protein PLU99_13585 [Phycisphaerae bacterium]|nr:hypothetical protein [Phycisphaerae bacterium]